MHSFLGLQSCLLRSVLVLFPPFPLPDLKCSCSPGFLPSLLFSETVSASLICFRKSEPPRVKRGVCEKDPGISQKTQAQEPLWSHAGLESLAFCPCLENTYPPSACVSRACGNRKTNLNGQAHIHRVTCFSGLSHGSGGSEGGRLGFFFRLLVGLGISPASPVVSL